MKKDKSRSGTKFPNLFFIFIFFGLILGGYVSARETPPGFTRFNSVLTHVLQKSATDLDTEKLMFNAIDGMLDTLDPHTHFLDPTVFTLMRSDQEGKFSGIGIAFDIRNGNLTVVSPIENTPAFKAGLRAGDVIIEIEGESTIDISESEVINKLRGPKGEPVEVTIQRVGVEEPFKVSIIRDDIPLESVKYPTMLTDDVGYIRVIRFAKNTPAELEQYMRQLESKGMKKLILDLRGNGGGLLESAVAVSSKFLEPGRMVVYTRGRIHSSIREWSVPKGAHNRDYPIVILVGPHTASGAEIVAGAVQDWDRGIILGDTTYGKGLVQRLFPEQKNSAIQVTTSQYFTPSGRNIQKPYDTLHRKYFRKLSQENAELSDQAKTPKTYQTLKKKRDVYGGGGITPDYEVEREYPDILWKMDIQFLFFDFAIKYTTDHPDIPRNFQITSEVITEFRDFLKEKNAEYQEEEFNKNIKFISNHILAEIIGSKYGQDEKFRVLMDQDNVLWEALKHFTEAESLLVHTDE